MKPTREEILEIAEQYGKEPRSCSLLRSADTIINFFLAAYKMGQEEMRERAANHVGEVEGVTFDIETLPLEGEES